MPKPSRRPVVLLTMVLASPFAGCIDLDPSWLADDPLGESTFEDAGSDNTTWALRIAGRFHLPAGTALQVEAHGGTCSTGPLAPLLANNTTVPCRAERGGIVLYNITLVERGQDARPSHDDLLLVSPAADVGNGTLFGPHRLRMALHPELPLFVLAQEFGPRGRLGDLHVEVLG